MNDITTCVNDKKQYNYKLVLFNRKKIEMTFKSGYLFHVSLATRNKGAKWEWAKASIYLQRQASSDPCISTRPYCLQFLHLLRVYLLISDHALTDTPKG